MDGAASGAEPGGRRFVDVSAWQRRATSTFARASVASLEPSFSGAMRSHGAAGLRVSRVSVSPSVMERSSRHIRPQDDHFIVVCLLLSGRAAVIQDGRRVDLLPGEASLYDTGRPYAVQVDTPVDCIGVVVPSGALGLAPRTVDSLVASRMPGTDAVTTLALQSIAHVEGSLDDLPGGAAERAMRSMTSLCEMLCVHHGMTRGLPDGSATVAEADSVLRYIDDHLGDPDLGPATIASAHFMSLRKLHSLAHDSGLNIAGWIRLRRLEKCRRDLADPALRFLGVAQIGARWGLTNAPHFSTMFRAQFHTSPSEYRSRHLCER